MRMMTMMIFTVVNLCHSYLVLIRKQFSGKFCWLTSKWKDVRFPAKLTLASGTSLVPSWRHDPVTSFCKHLYSCFRFLCCFFHWFVATFSFSGHTLMLTHCSLIRSELLLRVTLCFCHENYGLSFCCVICCVAHFFGSLWEMVNGE